LNAKVQKKYAGGGPGIAANATLPFDGDSDQPGRGFSVEDIKELLTTSMGGSSSDIKSDGRARAKDDDEDQAESALEKIEYLQMGPAPSNNKAGATGGAAGATKPSAADEQLHEQRLAELSALGVPEELTLNSGRRRRRRTSALRRNLR
jgi:hypothetical protein